MSPQPRCQPPSLPAALPVALPAAVPAGPAAACSRAVAVPWQRLEGRLGPHCPHPTHAPAAIPLIVHPIDGAVHALLNATLRPALRLYICRQAGGTEAGLAICKDCGE